MITSVQVTGVDPSLELQAYAREIARDEKLDVEFLAVGAEAIPLEDKTFDTAVITWTSVHDSRSGCRAARGQAPAEARRQTDIHRARRITGGKHCHLAAPD